MKRIIVAALVAAAILAMAVPAHAAEQTVDATVSTTLSMDTAPTAAISGWTLASTGSNSKPAGTVGINSNQPYRVDVTADKTRMSEWDTDATPPAYVSGGDQLGLALSITGANSGGGTAILAGAGSVATTDGVATLFAAGTGLGTDNYSSTLSQVTTITDPALVTGHTYHVKLTYTLASTL